MIELGVPERDIQEYIEAILDLGMPVEIKYYHLPIYPNDCDDIPFILCAENGKATHLISYDKHLLDLKDRYQFNFKICKIVEFLQELRSV